MRLGELELVEQLPSGTAVAELVLNADSRYLYGTLARHNLAHRVRKTADNVVLLYGDYSARFLSRLDDDVAVDGLDCVDVDKASRNALCLKFLNSLKRDSNVYYNGHVRPNIHIGESSDGQFIYMAGLLPLKSEITVNIVKDKTVCGLPALLKREGLIKQSRIVVPTSPTFWEQDAMNRLYGIDTTYSKFDWDGVLEGNKDLEDGQIFTMASKADRETDSPFFSLILTMSMHNPYKRGVDHGFTLTDDGLSNEYLNYLVDCHYFDMQLHKYIDELKRTGLYDNSLIVITADHQAHPVHLNMKEGQISDELPLYIINGGMDSTNSWTGPCNQLDIYTTLLDLYGIETDWRGLGHTLYTRDYKNSVSERTQELSEWIIRGNYWKSRIAE